MSLARMKWMAERYLPVWHKAFNSRIDSTDEMVAIDEMVASTMRVLPELIALWEAVVIDRAEGVYEENMHRTDDALSALNAKAAEVMK